MIYRFDDFELDPDKAELRKGDETIALEPQVLSLLTLLVERRDRMVSKDEIVDQVWGGRIVSESAVASRIKSLRRALGDDGKTQRFIRTVHGRGFRFVGEVAAPVACTSGSVAMREATAPETLAKPSIAVLPFQLAGAAGPYAAIAEALPHELIAELSRLRWLHVIARGSSFRFRETNPDLGDIAKALNVRYCLSGVVDVAGDAIKVTVELIDTRDGGVVWGDRFAGALGAVHEIRAQIVSQIVSALEIHIPANEARIARLKSPDHLDAWSAYHIGLQHMHRFTEKDNAAAAAMFERAIAREPTFARAHAGLSFTHFQNAFLIYDGDPAAAAAEARRSAERGVELDLLDPFANFTMGRVFWLEGDLEGSLGWLDRATTLSPNYAQGLYARAWADTLSGRGAAGEENVVTAMALSPLDPLLYAMLATRALSYVVRGDYAAAALWADKAARSPGAHVHVAIIAALTQELNGAPEKAAAWAATVRTRNASVGQDDFFRSFPFGDQAVRSTVSKALTKHGI